MIRYAQGPRHARRGPHRGILLPLGILVVALAVLVGEIIWMVVT